jgi:hypothetical protein
MGSLPDWLVLVLIVVLLLLASGRGAWLFGRYLIGGILKFIKEGFKNSHH